MQAAQMTAPSGALRAGFPSRTEQDAVWSKINWRIVPIILIAYIMAFLDRINVGYAKLTMQQDLQFSDEVYGLGAGIFFITYLLFEVPSNLRLEKIGARRTFLRIMVLWGLTSAATAFVQTPTQFYILRLLLGVFEAGFFPGIILYLTYWYPSTRRGRVTGPAQALSRRSPDEVVPIDLFGRRHPLSPFAPPPGAGARTTPVCRQTARARPSRACRSRCET